MAMRKSSIPALKTFCRLVSAVAPCMLACSPPPDAPVPGNKGDSTEPPSPGSAFDRFFASGDQDGQSLVAKVEAKLPGGVGLTLPGGSPDGIDIGFTQGSLTQEAVEGFRDMFPDTALSGPILQITLRAAGATPDYLILRLPASDLANRIFVAGAIDADTSNLAWEPVPTQFDAATGMATVLIGWEQLGSVVLASETTQKSLTLHSSASPIVYTGHVAIGVGGQSFQGEVVFVAQEPTTSLTVPFNGPPIPARARIGLGLSNITHQPLDSLTVTSDFGPRQQPIQGASTVHKGVDYRAADGTNVYAAGDGVVITSRCANGSVNCGPKANGDISAGYIVEIRHADGELTRYLHLTNPAIVPVGVTVAAGQLIAYSDSTGGVAAHLHFETRKNGVAVDPELIFNEQATATLAMAVDNQIEFGTQQQIPITRGILTAAEMAEYVNVVELTDVEPGSHKLQFVLVQPRGRLAVLAEVPLTVLPPGDFVGNEVSFAEITWMPSDTGLIDYQYTRFTSSFSLVAIDDRNAQGQAHLTFETKSTTTYSSTQDCPTDTSASGLVEWDVPVHGFYRTEPDGTLFLQITASSSSGPPFLITYTRPGCTAPAPTANSGHIWTGVAAHLANGRYDLRQVFPLHTDETGQHFYEVHVQQTNGQ